MAKILAPHSEEKRLFQVLIEERKGDYTAYIFGADAGVAGEGSGSSPGKAVSNAFEKISDISQGYSDDED